MKDTDTYNPRLIDSKIDLFMQAFGAVLIYGPKLAGKTTTGKHHCKSFVFIQDPTDNFSTKRLARLAPKEILMGPRARLIDEWTDVPLLWDAVRAECDNTREKGLFILTGSNFPIYSDNRPAHSGAGRIASLYLNSMSLYETGDSSGQVSLEDLFDENKTLTPTSVKKTELSDIIRLCVRGGWPSTLNSNVEQQKYFPRQYLMQCINDDILTSGLAKNKRNPRKVEVMFNAIARYEYTSNIIPEVTAYLEEKGEKISRNTIAAYIDIMSMMYIIKEQLAFIPEIASMRRPGKTSKFRFTDPSLVVAALGKEPEALQRDLKTVDYLFDNLCVHELEVYADAIEAKVYHYKDNYNDYLDSVIELKDGRWGAFMHCLSEDGHDKAASELLRISKSYEAVGYAPSCLCILSGTEPLAYTREDGIKVVPITALKP